MRAEDFNEQLYLKSNPDVEMAVRNGRFATGWEHYEAFGRREGRSLSEALPATREDKLLSNLDRHGKGLEIGPSHNPVAPKSAGFDVDILDHLDSDGLRKKYVDHGVEVGQIEGVDFVWQGENLVELIGQRSRYDWIIASHVIEHIPDPISFLQQCEELLKPAGRLALVIPDKRYCFDHLQPLSPTGAFLDAFQEKRKRPSPGQIFDHLSNACTQETMPAWSAQHSGSLQLIHSLEQSIQVWDAARKTDGYFDVHCWRFQPQSFAILISDLQATGLLNLGIVAHYDTVGCEFYVILQRGEGFSLPVDRLSALESLRQA